MKNNNIPASIAFVSLVRLHGGVCQASSKISCDSIIKNVEGSLCEINKEWIFPGESINVTPDLLMGNEISDVANNLVISASGRLDCKGENLCKITVQGFEDVTIKGIIVGSDIEIVASASIRIKEGYGTSSWGQLYTAELGKQMNAGKGAGLSSAGASHGGLGGSGCGPWGEPAPVYGDKANPRDFGSGGLSGGGGRVLIDSPLFEFNGRIEATGGMICPNGLDDTYYPCQSG